MSAFKIVSRDLEANDGKHYYIIETMTERGLRYGVIPHDLIVNGKLTQPVFGCTMLLSETVSELIQRVDWKVKVDRWVEEGYDIEAASIAAVQGIDIKDAQALWDKHKPEVKKEA